MGSKGDPLAGSGRVRRVSRQDDPLKRGAGPRVSGEVADYCDSPDRTRPDEEPFCAQGSEPSWQNLHLESGLQGGPIDAQRLPFEIPRADTAKLCLTAMLSSSTPRPRTRMTGRSGAVPIATACGRSRVSWRSSTARRSRSAGTFPSRAATAPDRGRGRVYVTDRVLEPKAQERVHCFDWRTGRRLWSYAYDCDYGGSQLCRRASRLGHDRPRPRLFAGAVGHLFCFDAARGTVLWSKDLNREYRIRMPIWGNRRGAPDRRRPRHRTDRGE